MNTGSIPVYSNAAYLRSHLYQKRKMYAPNHSINWDFCLFFLFLKIFFKLISFLKAFIEFVTILLLFYALVFWPWGMWGLPVPGMETMPPALEVKVLATELPAKSLFFFSLVYINFDPTLLLFSFQYDYHHKPNSYFVLNWEFSIYFIYLWMCSWLSIKELLFETCGEQITPDECYFWGQSTCLPGNMVWSGEQ